MFADMSETLHMHIEQSFFGEKALIEETLHGLADLLQREIVAREPRETPNPSAVDASSYFDVVTAQSGRLAKTFAVASPAFKAAAEPTGGPGLLRSLRRSARRLVRRERRHLLGEGPTGIAADRRSLSRLSSGAARSNKSVAAAASGCSGSGEGRHVRHHARSQTSRLRPLIERWLRIGKRWGFKAVNDPAHAASLDANPAIMIRPLVKTPNQRWSTRVEGKRPFPFRSTS